MKTTQAQRSNVPTIPSLQQELTDFVTQTEQRLQELASMLSACRDRQLIQPVAAPTPDQKPPFMVEQPETLEFEEEIKFSTPTEDSVPDPLAGILHPDLDPADPLARLHLIKKRIAARIDQQDATH